VAPHHLRSAYFDITRRQTQVAVLTAMVLGLLMNAAIGVAFSAGGWAFVIPLVVTQVAQHHHIYDSTESLS
jgi:low temperature requirement protein LtrA